MSKVIIWFASPHFLHAGMRCVVGGFRRASKAAGSTTSGLPQSKAHIFPVVNSQMRKGHWGQL